MATVSSLGAILTRRRVRQLASSASFARSEAYATDGRVRSVVVRGGSLTATVSGSKEYAVRLTVGNGALQHANSSPWRRNCRSPA